ncbi:MAG: hypothetical protein V7L00_29315 [Nostoc sp.]|uniref:hypothetical protein n=1 Tax=Nostoc sp. TaxID=1180 RepID=UPI002FFC7629
MAALKEAASAAAVSDSSPWAWAAGDQAHQLLPRQSHYKEGCDRDQKRSEASRAMKSNKVCSSPELAVIKAENCKVL